MQILPLKRMEIMLGLFPLIFLILTMPIFIGWPFLRDFHRQTIGEQLIDAACEFAKNHVAKTMTVETLSPSEKEENYMKTYQFYQSTGFIHLFNLKPQEYEWDMVYMVKNLENSVCSNKTVSIKRLCLADIPTIVDAFQRVNWQKSALSI